jgi:phosphoribosylformylglycinamidine synthase
MLFSAIGLIDDVTQAVTMDAKRAGDGVYVLGLTGAELGGSEYYDLLGQRGKNVPRVDARGARRLYEALSTAIGRGLVASCHDCSDGGLGVALAETAFAGALGMEIDLRAVPRTDELRDDFLLFSESASRFVVTIRPEHDAAFAEAMQGLPCAAVGAVTDTGRLRVLGQSGMVLIEASLDRLKAVWQQPLNW